MRVFLIVLDSYGIGALPDAGDYNDEYSNTLASIAKSPKYNTPMLKKLGLFNIDGIELESVREPLASFARMAEKSHGKDTTIGHWEIAGIVSKKPLPTYPDGFPKHIIDEFVLKTGRGVLCNKPYSGTRVLEDYGDEHMSTGKLIVYTSADSVFQIAAHEEVVSLEELYRYCEIARSILVGEHGVGRVIARPFVSGKKGGYVRTSNRHDFSIEPPADTMLDLLSENGIKTIGIGKINDIFAGHGISQAYRIENNIEGMHKTIELANQDFEGLCFVNLVDFDMVYGHRNDVDGYADAATQFDCMLCELVFQLKTDDILIITADHGCDPATPSTDHSREYTPMIIYGDKIHEGVNLGTRSTFADISATILDLFGVENTLDGESFKSQVYGRVIE